MPRVDLHLHSTASDGRLCPAELVRRAATDGLSVISITDHDTVGGIPEAVTAASLQPDVRLIPGVEISADVADGEVHILGYGINYADPELAAALQRMRGSRWERARRMVARLTDLGLPIDMERVRELADGGAVGRPHIARALIERGHVSSFQDAFARYIGREGPAYVRRDKLIPAEAVALVLRSGGFPAMAHPLTVPDPEAMAADLRAAGLAGLEVYYGGYTCQEVGRLARLATLLDLVPTGGSDFHGLEAEAGMGLCGVEVPAVAVERFLGLAGKSGEPGPQP